MGKTLVEQLNELWDRTRYRLYSPKYALLLWRLKKQFNLKRLKVGDVKVLIPKTKLPDCDQCSFLCCTGKKAIVSLRLKDIASLLDGNLHDHICHDKSIYSIFNKSSDAEESIKQKDFSQIYPVLTRDKYGTCKLLSPTRLCGAYPYWPLSCARYPFAVDPLNRVVFYARGCSSYRELSYKDVNSQQYNTLVMAALQSYNQQIQDIILLAVAFDELESMGLVRYLNMTKLLTFFKPFGYKTHL